MLFRSGYGGGLGGRDIRLEEFVAMAAEAHVAVASGVAPATRLLYTDRELRELRKLQAIAGLRHNEVRTDS